jgi:hypothetical protein
MVDWFRCNKCKKLFALMPGTPEKCLSCDGTSGEVISGKHVKEGVEAGTYFKLGKRSKKKPR